MDEISCGDAIGESNARDFNRCIPLYAGGPGLGILGRVVRGVNAGDPSAGLTPSKLIQKVLPPSSQRMSVFPPWRRRL